MAKAKQGLIRGMGTHRRTEGDYMATLLDAVTLDDWRDVVAGALQLAKGGDAQARAWLAQWWLKAVRQAEAEDTTPLLCWRADRMRDWTFVWPASLHCLDAPRYPADVKDTLSADPLIWWRMVRRWT